MKELRMEAPQSNLTLSLIVPFDEYAVLMNGWVSSSVMRGIG